MKIDENSVKINEIDDDDDDDDCGGDGGSSSILYQKTPDQPPLAATMLIIMIIHSKLKTKFYTSRNCKELIRIVIDCFITSLSNLIRCEVLVKPLSE